MKSIIGIATILSVSVLLSTLSHVFADNSVKVSLRPKSQRFAGAVYVMTNNLTQNSIIAYGRRSNGQLVLLGTFQTGGRGAFLDNGDGIDPLVSAGSLALVGRLYLVAVNAGSRSVSVLKIRNNLKLRLVSTRTVEGTGPVSIAVSRNIVYVASADADGLFESPLDRQGVVSGFKLSKSGRLLPIRNSVRSLGNRPATVKFSSDGRFLLVSNVFAGSAALETRSVDQLVVFKVLRNGQLSEEPVDSATSTELNNPAGRNLPVTLGFQIVQVRGVQYVIATEARGLGPDGEPAEAQTPSVSSWELSSLGKLKAVDLDVLVGLDVTNGQRATCWIQFSQSLETFWVVNTGSGTISAFSFSAGRLELAKEVAAEGEAPVDLAMSQDGKFLYQMFAGSVGVFRVGDKGHGQSLTLIQNPMNVPEMNPQGIVAF